MGEIALTFFYLAAGVTGVTIGIEMYRRERRYQGLTTALFGLWIMIDAVRWFIAIKAFADYARALSIPAVAQAASVGEAVHLMEEAMITAPPCVRAMDWLEILFAFAGTGALINEGMRERRRWLCFLLVFAYFFVNAVFWLTAYFFAGELRDYAMAAKGVWVAVWSGHPAPNGGVAPRPLAGLAYLLWAGSFFVLMVGAMRRQIKADTSKATLGWWERAGKRWEEQAETPKGRAIQIGLLTAVALAVASTAAGHWGSLPLLGAAAVGIAAWYAITHPRAEEEYQWLVASAVLYMGLVLEIAFILLT